MHHAYYLDSSICLQLGTTTVCEIIYMILIYLQITKKSTTMFDFFQKKILKFFRSQCRIANNKCCYCNSKKYGCSNSRKFHSPIPENVDIPISENNHISQTQFQKVDLDILRNNDFWVFFWVDSLLILYECVFEKKKSLSPPPPPA